MRTGVVIALVAALGATAAAARAQVTERIRVTTAGGPVTRTIPRGVFVDVVSPPDYDRVSFTGTQGRWVGPPYRGSADPSAAGKTFIAWTLAFAHAKDRIAAVGTVPTRGWPTDIKGGVSIQHVIRARTVGTILGHYLLTRAPGQTSAAYEAALAFPVSPGLFALLRFELLEPATDDDGAAGTFMVDGVRASLWNRGQAFWALTSPRLEGTLPPTRVIARAVGGGEIVRGQVADAFRHPVVGARVLLQRAQGGWRTVKTTRTSGTGTYAIRGVAPRGRYRAVAKVGATAAWSAPIVAGR